ncbi:MAG: hypothetical protein IT384_17895 [Deltaproteobacteria bacterium]|nr:hypothetical protein [Deltaproteobacteria bacterium]
MLMRSTLFRSTLTALLLGSLVFSGCSCEDEAPVGGDSGVPPGTDTGLGGSDGGGGGPDLGFDDGGHPIDGGGNPDFGFDDAGNPIDGGFPSGDGSVTDGNPLEQPLSEFCRGTGTVVIVGAGDQCAGDIAENTFRFGLCACETADVQSNLSLDAFDSNLGTYGATLAGGGTNILSDGQLGINGPLTMDGKLTVAGSAFIGGNAFQVGSQSAIEFNLYSGGPATQLNSSTNIGRNAFVNGDVSGRYNITGDLTVPPTATVSAATRSNLGGALRRAAIPPLQPCACGADEILDIPGLTEFGRTHNDNAVNDVITSTTWATGAGPDVITLPCGRYYLTEIQHPRGLTIIAEDRTVLYVDGDMTIGGGLNLDLQPGAEIDLFVAGSLSVQAAARLGTRDAPSKVRTYVGGTSTITFSASSQLGGNLYAPRAHVVFGASANLYGALFCRSVEFSGSADIHFDTAVRNAGQSCEPPPNTDGGVGDGGTMGPPDFGFDDAGNPIDGGFFDATPAPDATPIVDGGVVDAGSVDAGSVDSGVANPDAGPRDSGVSACTGCFQCGDQACINNMCAPCQSDLDCCAPYVCSPTGQCIILL